MLSTETRQSIKRMHAEGSSVTDIAKALSISRTTVYAYMRDQFRGMRPQSRGSVSKLSEANQDKLKEAFEALGRNTAALAELLRSDPEHFGLARDFTMTNRSVLRYFSAHFPDLMTPRKPSYQPFVCEAGQQLQIDFTFGEFRFAKKKKATKLSFFEAVYPWSHKAFVMVLPGTSQSSWLMGISTCIARYGFPAEILCDNNRSLVIQNRGSGKVQFHPDFEWLLKPFKIRPIACRPNRPQTKGAVERFGRYFKENCLPALQYRNEKIYGIKELQDAIEQWMTKTADARVFQGKTVAQWYEEEARVLAKPGHADTFMPVAHRITTASRRAGVYFYGQRFQLPAESADTAVAITVRHNGEFRISSLAGQELLTGSIPMEQMQSHKFDGDFADDAETAPALEPERPNKVNLYMQDLVGIEGFTND